MVKTVLVSVCLSLIIIFRGMSWRINNCLFRVLMIPIFCPLPNQTLFIARRESATLLINTVQPPRLVHKNNKIKLFYYIFVDKITVVYRRMINRARQHTTAVLNVCCRESPSFVCSNFRCRWYRYRNKFFFKFLLVGNVRVRRLCAVHINRQWSWLMTERW